MQRLPASVPPINVKSKSDYPGESARPHEIQQLADAYKQASTLLLSDHGRQRSPLSWAPYRQIAIHSIELYLNALLLSKGSAASRVRGFHHDLGSRVQASTTAGLKLRKRTESHLRKISASREYLITRYGPEMTSTLSEINRLTATLEEVATKVTRLISQETRAPAARISSR